MANYIGKIAAIGTINMSQFASGLNASARDVDKYARRLQSTITAANTAAGRSFQEIFTPLQRLERALQASQNSTLDVRVGGSPERIRAIVGAAEDIARPLAASQKQFSTLAATVQNEFIGSLVRAQNAAEEAENAINRGQIKNAAGYERLKRIVDSVTESQRRLSEASVATAGLATGRELRFQQSDFASELQRASALQGQASALPADARRSGAVGQLVELQRREAEEAARLLSVLENVRNTRQGDAAAAQANLDAQVQRLGEVNAQLERQVRLSNEATRAAEERARREREIQENIGALTRLRSDVDPTGRSIRERLEAQQRVLIAAQEESAFRQRAADNAEREAVALERSAQAAGRASAREFNRRDGVFAARNAESFESATAGVFEQQQRQRIAFGREQRTLETELARVQSLGARFVALPPQVQQELESFRAALENTANAAASGATGGLQLLIEAYVRVEEAIRRAEIAARDFRPIQGGAVGAFGPTRDDIFPRSQTDPTGRSIRERLEAQQRVLIAAQEESAFRQRAADNAEREAVALERSAQAAGRASAREFNRRDGVFAARNAESFESATAGVFEQQQRQRIAFGREQRTLETELARVQSLGARFVALPPQVQQELESFRAALENTANAADSGATGGLQLLIEAYVRVEEAIRRAERAAREFRPIQGNAAGQFGPTRADFVTDFDPQGRTIAERIRQQAAVREEQERRAEQAADQQRRREVATAFLPPIIDPPEPPGVAETQALSDRLGPDIESAAAGFERLEAATIAVKSQISSLPEPVRAQFIPALRNAEAELLRLQAVGAPADQIEEAAASVDRLRNGVTRADRAFQAFGGNFRDFADAADFQGAASRLQFLRQQLLRATGDTTRAEEAADDLAAAFQVAANTPGGFREFASQLDQVEREAIEAAAAVLGVSPDRLAEGLRRAGDVSRGAFGNVQLAVQQAAFAVDDFFSVTGDLSQRIRAAGNNISQLAFILGGTKGLIIGVAASIGAQLVVAISRWINSGVEAQDSTKALNEALSDQIRLVNELAESFSRLGRSITLDAFSGGARSAEEFRREIEQLRRQQEDARRQRAGLFDPEAQRQRAIQARSERDLQKATDIGAIVAFQREIEQARARERVAADEAFRRPPIAPQDAINSVVESIDAISRAAAADAASRATASGAPLAAADEARRAELEFGRRRADEFRRRNAGLNTAAEAESAVQQQIDRLTLRRRQTGFTSVREARAIDAELERLQQILVGLQGATIQELDDATIQVIEGLRATASGIQLAQEDLQNAIRQGIPGALLLGEELKAAADSLTAAQRDFEQASSEVRNALALPSATEQDRATRDAAITAARQRQQEAAQRVEDERVRSRGLEDRAFAARQQLALDPQATIDAALARARENIQQAGAPAGILARQLRELEFRRDELSRAADDPRTTDAQLEAINREIAAVKASIVATEAATLALRTFADSIGRAGQAVQSDLDSARQEADAARRRDIAFSTPETRREVDRTEENLRRQQDAANRAQAEIERTRIREEQEVARGQAALDSVASLQSRVDVGDNFFRALNAFFDNAENVLGDEDFNNEAEVYDRIRAEFGENSDEFRRASALGDEFPRRRRELAEAGFQVEGQTSTDIRRQLEERRKELEDAQAAVEDSFAAQFAELRNIEQQLQAGVDDGGAERERLVSRREELQQQLQPEIDRLREQEVALREASAREREVAGLEARGFDLTRTPAQRASEELARDLKALRLAFGRQAEETTGLVDQAGLRQAQDRVFGDAVRQQAPLLAQFSDEVFNALLQGPSRAALQATDASTLEGQRELNRLLRGDDPARDVNLLELQRQTAELEKLVELAQNGPQVAN